MDRPRYAQLPNGLPPERIKEKADILENNLYMTISKRKGSSSFQFKLKRSDHPDEVILRALTQLMPRFNVHPRDFVTPLVKTLSEQIQPDKEARFEARLRPADPEQDSPDETVRTFEAAATPVSIEIIVRGLRKIDGRDGRIEKYFFDHEKSPGQILEDGVINFKEMNTYPTVNQGEYLMSISYDIPGKNGLSFNGNTILARESRPYNISIGEGVVRIEKKPEAGKPAGYFLRAARTGVILLGRDAQKRIRNIDIAGEVRLKKLDYATGNIGTLHTCPISLNVHVICSGFKVRVHGSVEAHVVDGGQVITNDEARITKAQPESEIMALKNIAIASAIRTRIISEKGTITIERELVDSETSSPGIIFEQTKGMLTSSRLEAENIRLKGLLFSGEIRIFFGHNLFVEKKERLKEAENLEVRRKDLEREMLELMERLHMEMKRLTRIGNKYPDLVQYIKPLLQAVQNMDYLMIRKQTEKILQKNSLKVVATVRNFFESLEKNELKQAVLQKEKTAMEKTLEKINNRMASMKLSFEGYLRRASTIKIFAGEREVKNPGLPDFTIDCEGDQRRYIEISGRYSHKKGFEFARQSG